MTAQDHFQQGVSDALREAQLRANREGRSIRVQGVWVNPSSAALSRKNVEFIPPEFAKEPKPHSPRLD